MNTSSPCMHREKKCSGNRLASQVSRDEVFITWYYNPIFSGVHALAQQELIFHNNLVNAIFFPYSRNTGHTSRPIGRQPYPQKNGRIKHGSIVYARQRYAHR